jgi:uncharacterized protein (DUF58 family)
MPEGITHFLTPQELSHLSRFMLQSRYVVEGNLAGRHRSPAKGASTEFADHRAYIAGDDPKRIDWKVLGRTERYYVRRYEDETNLRVYLIVDRSASMGYTSGKLTKYDYACRLAAAIGYVVVKGRDSVGLYLYADKIDVATGARNSFAQLNNVLKTLQRYSPSSATDTAKTLHQIAESVHRRALIVLFSDLFDQPQEVVKALAHFRKHHHDVIVFHVLDSQELDFTFKKGAQFEDMETGEKLYIDPPALAEDYRKAFAEFLNQYRGPCAEMNIDYRIVNTSHPPDMFIRGYLEERRKFSR